MKLPKVVDIIRENCVNCHRCISVCPVKYCNDGSQDHVTINEDLCIGCGECLKVCTAGARIYVDDFEPAMMALSRGEKMIAIVAPAVAAQFPNRYLNLNGMLKSWGISAVFDVSFGAELTVKSYLEHIGADRPKMVIAQPCPAIVTYIEIYQPELLAYLAPADSPMAHTMKMVRRFYPQYNSHRILVVSPCIAKKREFQEIGLGDYNVTITSIKNYLTENGLELIKFEETDYANDPAERAVLFSTPGGLLETAIRENPDVRQMTRKIEGPHTIYHYIDSLKKSIRENANPLLLDCLNCEAGCNGGTGTPSHSEETDILEKSVRERSLQMQSRYQKKSFFQPDGKKRLEKLLNKYWEPKLYTRTYIDRSAQLKDTVKIPSREQVYEYFRRMGKVTEQDIKNCSSCGYNSCEKMVTAIYNRLNQVTNCHFYLQHQFKADQEEKIIVVQRMTLESEKIVQSIKSNIMTISQHINDLMAQKVYNLKDISNQGVQKVNTLNGIIQEIEKGNTSVLKVIHLLNDISFQTNIIALNASVEAAHAGKHGKAFGVVAEEISRMAETTKNNTKTVTESLKIVMKQIEDSLTAGNATNRAFTEINSEIDEVISSYQQIIGQVNLLSQNSEVIFDSISQLPRLMGNGDTIKIGQKPIVF